MSRILCLALLLSLTSCATYSSRKHAVNAMVGTRSYDDVPSDVEGPVVYGLEGLLGLSTSGLGLEGGLNFGEDDGTDGGDDIELEAAEYFFGLRNTWNTDGLLQPYIGGGLTYLDTDLDIDGASDSDEFWGGYLRAGVGVMLGIFQGGIDLRATAMDESDVSFYQASLFLGLTF